jgi:ASPIC and UnbV/FG-GAP-like repeat
MDGVPWGAGRRAAVVAVIAAILLGATGACSSGEDNGSGEPRPTPTAEATADEQNGPTGIALADVAADVGLDFQHGAFRWDVTTEADAMHGGGVCWLDYDGDGWLDLYAVNSHAPSEAERWEREGGLPRNALFRNDGGTFTDVSDGSGADLAMQGNGCAAADFDRDGHTDLFVTDVAEGALLWNEGDGTFSEGAEAAGVDTPGWYTGAAVGDVDGNGWPDLFVAGYANLGSPIEGSTQGFPGAYTGVRDLLFLNEGPSENGGRVRFREVGIEVGLEVANFEPGLGAVFSDLDTDGDLDLYLANDTRPNRLYDNVAWPGGAAADPAGLGFRFEELAARAGVADPNAGMGVAAADYDLDGREDLFVTNARGQGHGVYHGVEPDLADPTFDDVRADLGVDLGASTGWGVTWGDLDLDCDLDVVLANGAIPVTDLAADAQPIEVLANRAADSDRSSPAFAAVEHPGLDGINGRGSAAADFDNDGDLDVAVGTIGGPLVLLENRGAVGNWLEVALDGFHPGAVVTVTIDAAGGGRGVTEMRREVQAGSSYLSSDGPRLHFGLADATEVRSVTVSWPGGEETTLDDVAANQILVVEVPE